MYNTALKNGLANRLYPERDEPQPGRVDQFVSALTGRIVSWMKPGVSRYTWIVDEIDRHTVDLAQMDSDALREAGMALGKRLRRLGFTRDTVGRAFALIREASGRTLGLRHMDVQLIGGLVLLNGLVAEMETGEGKTLTATLPAITMAMAGVPVHVITVNDYLAARDAEWMAPVFEAFGLTVGTIIHGLTPAQRRDAYRCHVTYCANKEVAFDYLRDRIVLWDRPSPIRMQLERLYGDTSRLNRLAMRGLHFAIVDEADSVLIDESRTPLIISAESDQLIDTGAYATALATAQTLVDRKDFTLSLDRTVSLTSHGKQQIAGADWDAAKSMLNPEQKEALVRQGLAALHLFDLDRHYLVKDGKVQIIDEYTGRLMADRSWERGLHQLIELKEGCEMTRRKDTRARISYQRFFRRYLGMAGMTGTAKEVSVELWAIYRLKVASIPTNKAVQRKALPVRWFATAEEKWRQVVTTIARVHAQGRPILVGTRSVEASEHLDGLLTAAGLPHRVLNARQDREEADIIAKAGERGRITVATNMAGRGTDIKLDHGVSELGGLSVVATELHDARRIDRQLFGRCGRQGDPGTVEAFVSFEDELFAAQGNDPIMWLASMSTRLPLGWFGRFFGQYAVNRAQMLAEQQNARMRKDLLRMDDQISDSMAFAGKPE